MRAFCGLGVGRDAISRLNFRHLPERHDLTKAVFTAVAEPCSTRRPPARWHDWTRRVPPRRESGYFGMKAHIGAKSGLVHTAGRDDDVHDAKAMARLIRVDDRAVYGDKGYASVARKRAAEKAGVKWAVKEKARPGCKLTARQRARNRRFGSAPAGGSCDGWCQRTRACDHVEVLRPSPLIARPGSTHATASISIAAPWPTGWARRRGCCALWLSGSARPLWRPRLVEARFGDAGLQVVGHRLRRHAADEGECAHMPQDHPTVPLTPFTGWVNSPVRGRHQSEGWVAMRRNTGSL
jgi:IS5 family transposase